MQIPYVNAKKSLGQNFMISDKVLSAEAAHATGKNVLEIGAGYGALTEKLCKEAKKVIAVEIDKDLCTMLKSNVTSKKLKILNKDFFKATDSELELPTIDIVIANIPYMLSSSVIEWLYTHKIQAVLCVQKEFAERMLAAPGSSQYSNLSVMTSLTFSITEIMEVQSTCFFPKPKVDSIVVYLKPRDFSIEDKVSDVISALMQHKRKKFRAALVAAHRTLHISKDQATQIAEQLGIEKRVVKMEPEEILNSAKNICGVIS